MPRRQLKYSPNFIFRVASVEYLLLLLFLLFSCGSGDRPELETNEPSSRGEGLNIPDTSDAANKIYSLLPVLLSDPATRELEIWYDQKDSLLTEWGGEDKLAPLVKSAVNKAINEGRINDAANLSNSLARISYLQGNYSECSKLFQEAFELAREESDATLMAWALVGQANTMARLENLEQAEIYVKQAEDLVQNNKRSGVRAHLLLTKAIVTFDVANVEPSFALARESLIQARALKLVELEKFVLLNLSYMYISQKKFGRAIALVTQRQLPSSDRLTLSNALLNFNLFEAYTGLKDYDKAYERLQEGCVLADSLNFAFGINFCQKSRAEHFESTGQTLKAFKAFKAYHFIDKKQTGLEVKREIQAIRSKQELLEKDYEIERLLRVEQEQQRVLGIRRKQLLLGLFGALFLLSGVFLVTRYRTRSKMADKNRVIAETKVQLLKLQMNPHFLFNAINGIQNYILKSDKIEAYTYLGKFSNMLRTITKSSTSGSINLAEEINLVKTYLELEKLRFRDAFTFEVKVDEALENVDCSIPSMMIQPLVENAIQHGLSGLPYEGELQVWFKPGVEGIECTIRDNGRGRKAAGEIAKREMGRNLSISTSNTQETIKHLQVLGYTSASIEIKDLFIPDGTTAGTLVKAHLPYLD